MLEQTLDSVTRERDKYRAEAHLLTEERDTAYRYRKLAERCVVALELIAHGETLPSYPAGLSHPDYLKHRQIAHEALRGVPASEYPQQGDRA